MYQDSDVENKIFQTKYPEILAPAGNKASFLAAMAARADAIYCGLKEFSARMEARNFSMVQLAGLTELAHEKGTRVYIALNSLLKPKDVPAVGSLLKQLEKSVKPDGLIVQDLAMLELVRQTGFTGEIHLSTLANVTFGEALRTIGKDLNVDRVVIPRELNIDEIKALAQSCPKGISLEIFVHGALCYGVSGRCYWSSFLGGKSGLRGRCVQPCRRIYTQNERKNRFFSCQDLSLDVLAKVLRTVPEIVAWKIEGRKKGPHYVYYTVTAYRILRDEGHDPKAKKEALRLLDFSLGRQGTHYFFLPQRPQQPVKLDAPTGSGFLIGRVKGTMQRPYVQPRQQILRGDILRVGYEDEGPSSVVKVKKGVPKNGRLDLKLPRGKGPEKGLPVFLVDRREHELEAILAKMEQSLGKKDATPVSASPFRLTWPLTLAGRQKVFQLHTHRALPEDTPLSGRAGYWLTSNLLKRIPRENKKKVWWWLPPVVWSNEEKEVKALVDRAMDSGGRHFVLNAPWQVALFQKKAGLDLWAGPFCNLSNPLAVNVAASLGYKGVIVSPELGRESFFELPRHSPLCLGIVVFGNWPLSLGRSCCDDMALDRPFTSPKGEQAWVRKYGQNYWVYPNWFLDITDKKEALREAGYSLFVHLHEPVPRGVKMKKRPGLWNWDVGLP